MSIPNIHQTSSTTGTSPLQAPGSQQTLTRGPNAPGLSFDQFQRATTVPDLKVGFLDKVRSLVFHPGQFLSFMRRRKAGLNEGVFQRMKMYNTLRANLDKEGKKHLKNLLKNGVLNDVDTDDRHSALYHLYALATTRRGRGYDPKILLKETVETLDRPYLITQKFAPLSENIAREILSTRYNPGLNRTGEAPAVKPLAWNDLNVETSATCVSSSVMYYMAEKKPGELARHLNELTSPMNAFFEKAMLDEISPNDPGQALEILKQNGIKYYLSGPNEVTVKVELPVAGKLRAVDSQKVAKNQDARNGIETAYQSALTFLATRSYDPATDLRDSEIPGETSKGLTEPEKTLMETIIKDNGGVMSVTYQAVAGKANPRPGEEGNSYLYGYTRTFEQTVTDIIEALKLGEFVIIGITDTDQSGAIVGGHEITITSAFVDKKDGELKFVVADSDDGVPAPVVRTARELVPRIHHAGMPLDIAKRVHKEQARNPGYFVPTPADEATFNPLPYAMEPMPTQADPAQQTPEPAQPAPAPQPAVQPAPAQPQQVVEWVPVYSYYPPQPVPYIPVQQPIPVYWPSGGQPQYPVQQAAAYPNWQQAQGFQVPASNFIPHRPVPQPQAFQLPPTAPVPPPVMPQQFFQAPGQVPGMRPQQYTPPQGFRPPGSF